MQLEKKDSSVQGVEQFSAFKVVTNTDLLKCK